MACDLAEVIMENWRSSNDRGENDFLAPESLPPTEIDTNQHVMVFREMLLAGATKVKIVKLSFKKMKRCLIFCQLQFGECCCCLSSWLTVFEL